MKNFIEVFRGLRLPTEIDPGEYGVNLTTDSPLDVSESRVFLGGDKVFKVYDGFMSQMIDWFVLCRYNQLAKVVGRLVSDNKEVEQLFGFPVRVVPIERIGVVSRGRHCCSVSEFIGGKNLNQMCLHDEELTIMIARFERLNGFLQQRTNESAVRVDFTNAKFDGDGRTVVVTDVCGVIASLNPYYCNLPAMLQ